MTILPSNQLKIEQLERLRSEDTPPPPPPPTTTTTITTTSWLPILLSHIGSQVKRIQSQIYTFKEFAKTLIF